MNINALHKAKSPLWTLIKLAAAGLFLYLLFTDSRISLAGFSAAFKGAKFSWLGLSIIAGLLGLWLNILRWHNFLLVNDIASTWKQSAKSYLSGMFLGFLSPGRLAEFGRGYGYAGVPLKKTALATLAERTYFMAFTFFFGLIGALLASRTLPPVPRLPYGMLVVLLALLSLISLWIIYKGSAIQFKGLFAAFPITEPGRFYLLTLTNVVFVVMVVQVHCIFRAFEPVHLITSFVTLSLTLTALSIFPITFGNLGVREACFIFFLSQMEQFPENEAFGAGLIVFVENILLPSLLGFGVVMAEKVPGLGTSKKTTTEVTTNH